MHGGIFPVQPLNSVRILLLQPWFGESLRQSYREARYRLWRIYLVSWLQDQP